MRSVRMERKQGGGADFLDQDASLCCTRAGVMGARFT